MSDDRELDYDTAAALLIWQVDLGATEAIGDAPVNRYDLAETVRRESPDATPVSAPSQTDSSRLPPASSAPASAADPLAAAVGEATEAAARAPSLEALREAMAVYDHCDLKRGARNLVFCDGLPGARIMIVGEAPGREEDAAGRPFVGRAGQLLDRMFAAIDLSRSAGTAESAVYITNVLPWRPPQNRDPSPEEIAMMRPFLMRHIELAAPELLVIVGNISCQALLGQRGITRLRGGWTEAAGRPALPVFHPAYLLRNPAAKRETWADLLALKARLRDTPKGSP